ncbi:TPA: ead/Ea22-like family protein [Enterobacter hormaechei subsp. steigerwaltii]|nr:ead/Ea22-like family protein [Enterobacter hormaechei subsp. steigerwaltii]HAV1586203.1 ead/Ea22-like family protein [Enterobacter hormaechei subsp. steigerwaltii]
MSNIYIRALREAAVRAGGVKWQYMRATQHSKAYITDDKGSTVVNCTDGDVPAKCAGFLESANPAAVLALLDELEAAESRIAELEAREVVLPQRYGMLHRVDFNEPYHTEMVYKQHQVLEALHDAGVNVAAAGKGEAS